MQQQKKPSAKKKNVGFFSFFFCMLFIYRSHPQENEEHNDKNRLLFSFSSIA
jgi:hypothetical protein